MTMLVSETTPMVSDCTGLQNSKKQRVRNDWKRRMVNCLDSLIRGNYVAGSAQVLSGLLDARGWKPQQAGWQPGYEQLRQPMPTRDESIVRILASNGGGYPFDFGYGIQAMISVSSRWLSDRNPPSLGMYQRIMCYMEYLLWLEELRAQQLFMTTLSEFDWDVREAYLDERYPTWAKKIEHVRGLYASAGMDILFWPRSRKGEDKGFDLKLRVAQDRYKDLREQQ